MKHGGDTLTFKERYNGKIIDYSSNINPLGPPEALREAFERGFSAVTSYPDIKYRKLKGCAGRYLGCSDDEVLVGNGAVDIINTLSLSFRKVVVPVPSFVEYAERAEILGKEVVKLPMKDFSIDMEKLKDNISEGTMIIAGNPNNPNGKRIPEEDVLELQKLAEENGAFLVLDEAFYEFCPEDYDSIKLFKSKGNVCVIRAATKFFALPGIRLGYGFAAKSIADTYYDNWIPWNINVFADMAGQVIFDQTDYIKKTKDYIKTERSYMLQELNRIDGIMPYESETNFILLKLSKGNEDTLFDYLIQKGYMIRKASSFDGLDKTFVRIAVKDHFNNSRIISYIEEFCKIYEV